MIASRVFKFTQLILGFIFGVMILGGGTATTAYYFFTKKAISPARPIFSEEKPKNDNVAEKEKSNDTKATEKSTQEPPPKKEEAAKKEEELPPGAYEARVTWRQGLLLRAEPKDDGKRITGIGYDWKIIILQESDNKKWQKVRIPSSGQEGWVKAGNVKKVE